MDITALRRTHVCHHEPFTIDPDHWRDFEARFEQRAGLVDGEPGFIRNTILRPEGNSSDQHIVMTLWESREAFEAWSTGRKHFDMQEYFEWKAAQPQMADAKARSIK